MQSQSLTFEEAQDRLRTGKGSIRCDEVIAILESLGFVVNRRSKSKHHTYVHSAITEIAGNFACPHRASDPVKNNYVTKLLGVLRHHESALEEYLGERK